MAKRRRKTTVRRARARPLFKRKAKRQSSKKNPALLGTIIGGMAYGGLREFASNKLAMLTKGTTLSFLGNYSDEVVMGTLSYFMAKGKIPLLNKVPYSREIGKAGLVIESARIGSDFIAPALNKNNTTVPTSSIR